LSFPSDARFKRGQFFRLLFGQESKGFLCIAFRAPNKKGLIEEFYRWPDELESAQESIQQRMMTHNIYFCPTLSDRKRRIKDAITTSTCAWADLDECDPQNLLVKPSFTLESSPGRYQALWCFDSLVDASDAEDLSHRIAYMHARQGADRSGWDLTQLLRVPFTFNRKVEYGSDSLSPTVKIIDAVSARYSFEDFKKYPEVAGHESLSMPFPTELPKESPEEILQKYHKIIQPMALVLFANEPEADAKEGWSGSLWRLQMMCFEAGMSHEEVFVVASASACNKYERDGRPPELLWKDVCRSFVKNQMHLNVLLPPTTEMTFPLLTEAEREVVLSEESFVERYIRWAKGLGDAAWQYHQAGAFVTLSSLLAGSVQLPTSFGMVKPNLWFMILADTTLTRKSTAMDIAIDVIDEIDNDAVLATDGSIEGLMTSLSLRPNKPSIFLRDEFSGLLEQFTKRDYYAGMAETLTKLYDGKMQKRILRKEIIEVRDPCLIIFAGGIKNKVLGLLNFDNVSSGFVPRFVFITAESDVTNVRPLGPPTQFNLGERVSIIDELSRMYKHYNTPQTVQVGERGNAVGLQHRLWEAQFDPECWKLYNRLETDMMKMALQMEHADLMTPTYDRLSKSGLKAAVLLAASRQAPEDYVRVEKADMLRAMHYVEQWKYHTDLVLANVGKGSVEREFDKVLLAITNKPGISRSAIMQSYHLQARDASRILETLEQRGQIVRQRTGRTETLYPISFVVRGKP